MRLRRLSLVSFRAHAQTEIDLGPGVNLLVGPNGAGKTNVLEAAGYLALGKSFLGANEATVLRRGAAHFSVEGDFAGDTRPDVRLRVSVVPGEGKRAFANGVALDRIVDLVGRVPAVVVSPADRDLTAGGPSERRRFLDATLSQAHPVYLDALLRYRRALKQKTALLAGARRGRAAAPGAVEAWDEKLATLGGEIVTRRRRFLDAFRPVLQDAHERLGEIGDAHDYAYRPSPREADAGDPADALRDALRRTRQRSRDLGRTLVGPHLDEVEWILGGHPLRTYGSQGQHRTFALVVRVAQALFLADQTDTAPLLLLDDVFGQLDPDRTRRVADLLTSGAVGQSLVTAPSAEPFRDLVPFDSPDHALFHVERGTVRVADPVTPLSP